MNDAVNRIYSKTAALLDGIREGTITDLEKVSVELTDIVLLADTLRELPKIIVNGRECSLPRMRISYEDILRLSGKSPGVSVVVIYPITADKRDRTLTSGESADVIEGMRITAIDTGNA